MLTLLPWLWVGALGGLTQTALAVAAAATVGWLAATVLNGAFFAHYGRSRVWLVLVGGLSAGVALVLWARQWAAPWSTWPRWLALPALGFAARPPRSAGVGPPVTVTVPPWRLAAFGPLAFVDPEETSLILGLPTWATGSSWPARQVFRGPWWPLRCAG